MTCCLNPDCSNPQNPDGRQFCLSCGTELVPLLRNRYRIIKPLVGGGFARTYLAEDIDKLDELCVIKQLAPQLQGSWSLKKASQLFQQEAKRLQQLGEHPQIPSLYAYFKDDDYLYLVQQFIEGQNLLQELKEQGVFHETKIRELLHDLLPILETIHQQQVIHRDIKPENILRRESDGKLVLIDFGVSKQKTGTLHPNQGTNIGSFGYAPFEQLQSGEAYPASDLYSLGVTCFHLLTDISPWHLWMKQGYSWTYSWQQYLTQPITEGLEFVLQKLLQENYKQRYQSASAVLQDLDVQRFSEYSSLATIISSSKAKSPPSPNPESPLPTLLPRVIFTSSGSSFLAIAIFSFIGTIWISSGLWFLILSALIFIPDRPIVEKIYLLIIPVITTFLILLTLRNLHITNIFKDGLDGLIIVVLLVILSGLMAFTILILSRLLKNIIFNREV